jgi:hypothetical protein
VAESAAQRLDQLRPAGIALALGDLVRPPEPEYRVGGRGEGIVLDVGLAGAEVDADDPPLPAGGYAPGDPGPTCACGNA